MFRYYLSLGFRSLRRNPVLTALVVLTLSIGVATSMATLTLLHAMSGDPIPHKSDRLFVTQLDNGELNDDGRADPEPPEELTYRDTLALWEQAKAPRQTPVYGISPTVDAGRKDLPPFFSEAVAVGGDFFAMFDAPLIHGQAWSAEEDQTGARVAVISRSLAERLFEDPAKAVGKQVRLSDQDYAVVGVVDTWNPVPKFYRVFGSNPMSESEDLFLPFRAAIADKFDRSGNTNCSVGEVEPGFQGLIKSECTWMELWVELNNAGDRQAHLDYLDAYSLEQKALGRFQAAPNNRLRNVREWLDFNGVVSDDTRTASWLSFGFLLVCLVNAVGLMLAKFSARPGEVGVRRALGATRGEIFRQFLTEAGVLGLSGAVLGIGLTLAILAGLRAFDPGLELVAVLNLPMASLAVLVSIASALLAGLLPTWRACQVLPAMQLKSQ